MGLFKDYSGIGRSPVAANSSDSRCPGRRRYAVEVEWLEDRVVLSSFLVTNTMDNLPGQPLIPGSLRQAIASSNSTHGLNEIDFAPGLSGTIKLTGGQLRIMNNSVNIIGPGADRLSISGNNAAGFLRLIWFTRRSSA